MIGSQFISRKTTAPRSLGKAKMIGGFFGGGPPPEDDYDKKKEKERQKGAGRTMTSGGFGTGGEAPFEIRGFSLGDVALVAGIGITVLSFADYFTNNGGGLSGLGFVYGLPIALIGTSLKYAEIEPVELKSTPKTEALFEKFGNETIK